MAAEVDPPAPLEFDSIRQSVNQLEGELAVPIGFHESLMREHDDWSFVVKASALIEAAVTQVIDVHAQPDGVAKFLAGCTLGEKLRICKAADLSPATSGRVPRHRVSRERADQPLSPLR